MQLPIHMVNDFMNECDFIFSYTYYGNFVRFWLELGLRQAIITIFSLLNDSFVNLDAWLEALSCRNFRFNSSKNDSKVIRLLRISVDNF